MRLHKPAGPAALSLTAGILFTLAACSPDAATRPSAPNAADASRVTTDAAASDADDDLENEGEGLNRLKHIVVIYLENHSFDNLYGEFPGANGLANAGAHAIQVDLIGNPFSVLPTPPGGAFPSNLPNAPFNIEQYVPIGANTPDLVHRYYQEQMQIDGGRMDRFAAISDAKGLVMGFYHTARLPMAAEAASNTLCDNFFHGAFGGSFLNHIFLTSAQAPTFPNAPQSMRAQLDQSGKLVKDGAVTPNGYVVNTSYTVNNPHPPRCRPRTSSPIRRSRRSATGFPRKTFRGPGIQAVGTMRSPDTRTRCSSFTTSRLLISRTTPTAPRQRRSI